MYPWVPHLLLCLFLQHLYLFSSPHLFGPLDGPEKQRQIIKIQSGQYVKEKKNWDVSPIKYDLFFKNQNI